MLMLPAIRSVTALRNLGRRNMLRWIALAALSSALFIFTLSSTTERAAAQDPPLPLTLIALDDGIAGDRLDLSMTETAIKTLVESVAGQPVVLFDYGAVVGQFSGPFDSEQAPAAVEKALERLRNPQSLQRTTPGDGPAQAGPPLRSDQLKALTEVFAYLASASAAAETRVVIITPGRILGEGEATGSQLENMGELFMGENWTVDTITLPTTGIPSRELMSEVSKGSGGVYYDMGTGQGVANFLMDAISLEMAPLIDAELPAGADAIATMDIAPQTRGLRVGFIRLNEDTQVALFRPNGAPATSEFPNITLSETPNVVIFNITEPAPGRWQLRGIGAGSKLLAGPEIDNPLRIALVPQPPLPIGESGLIKAVVTSDGQPQPVTSSRILATVQLANGVTQLHEMNDLGVAGDEIAGDAVFTSRIPAPQVQGVNGVELQLTWADYEAVITGSGSYQTEHFPQLTLAESWEPNLRPGERVRIATVEVTTGDFPYLMTADELAGTLTGPGGETPVEFVLINDIEDGKGWEFGVFASPTEQGEHQLRVVFDSRHVGRSFTSAITDDSVGVTLILPTPTPVPPTPVSPTATPKPDPTPTSVPPTPTVVVPEEEEPDEEGGGALLWMVVLLLSVVVAVGVFAIWRINRTKPYGFIYDDMGRLIVDFGALERGLMTQFKSQDSVGADELPVLPFNGGVFRFTPTEVVFNYSPRSGDPSLRIDGRPIGGAVTLDERTWLGVGGRLLHFVAEPQDVSEPQENE